MMIKEKFWYVCLDCHKTRDSLNKDGECRYCQRGINNENKRTNKKA